MYVLVWAHVWARTRVCVCEEEEEGEKMSLHNLNLCYCSPHQVYEYVDMRHKS